MNAQNKLPIIRLISTDKNRIEGNAVEQLKKTAELPGMSMAIGMPDICIFSRG